MAATPDISNVQRRTSSSDSLQTTDVVDMMRPKMVEVADTESANGSTTLSPNVEHPSTTQTHSDHRNGLEEASSETTPADPSDREIISLYSNLDIDAKDRHVWMPTAFYKDGRLASKFRKRLSTIALNARREATKRREHQSKPSSSSDGLYAPLSSPDVSQQPVRPSAIKNRPETQDYQPTTELSMDLTIPRSKRKTLADTDRITILPIKKAKLQNGGSPKANHKKGLNHQSPPNTSTSGNAVDRSTDDMGTSQPQQVISQRGFVDIHDETNDGKTSDEQSFSNAISPKTKRLHCNDSACPIKSYVDDILKIVGISLKTASAGTQEDWNCPLCELKASSKTDEDGLDEVTPTNLRTRFGRDLLKDEEIGNQLRRLSIIMTQYTTMLKTEGEVVMSLPFLDHPQIIDEQLNQQGPVLVDILREMLDVPKDISLRSQGQNLGLQNVPSSTWVKGVLAYLIRELIFHRGAVFEDVSALREGLSYSFREDVADMAIQDYRLRTCQTNAFKASINARCELDTGYINSTMFHIGGGNNKKEERHRKLALISREVQSTLSAYTGVTAEIWANVCTEFDPELHEIENPPFNPLPSSVRILMTVTPGIRFKSPGYEWRTVVKAKVVLMEPKPSA